MSLLSWLRNRPTGRRAPSTPAARFRPRLEALDDRLVPTLLYVSTNLDSGASSLRAEIAAAQPGDTIAFDKSLKGETITLTSGELLIDKGLTIQTPSANPVTISGGNSSRVFEVAAGAQLTLTGLTISGGDGHAAVVAYTPYDGDGGAILNSGTLTVSNSIVTSSTAGETGGGIFSTGDLTVNKNSTISDNTAYGAGGVYNASGGTANLKDSTVSGNTATGGLVDGVAWGSTLSWYYGGGGGVWNDGLMTVSGSLLSGNTVTSGLAGGGGIYNSGALTVSNSIVSGNSANAYGGGIYNDERARLTLDKDLVTQNTADQGGGIYTDEYALLTLHKDTVTGNTSGYGPDIDIG